MRRAAHIGRVVLVYLLLGLVTSWAVAWGLALLPPGRLYDQMYGFLYSPGDPIGEGWRSGIGSSRVSYDHSGGVSPFLRELPRHWSPSQANGPDWNATTAYLDLAWAESWGRRYQATKAQSALEFIGPRNDEGPFAWSGIDDARGFPFVALWCSWDYEVVPAGQGAPISVPKALHGGFSLRDHAHPGLVGSNKLRALPYMPIWSGLALNTAFYALLFFAVVRITRGLKHARRYKRGLCPRCKYDRVFDYQLPCPECGHEGRARPATAVV